jgi:hypothetical protein
MPTFDTNRWLFNDYGVDFNWALALAASKNILLLSATLTLFWTYKAYTWNRTDPDWRWAPAGFVLAIMCFLFWHTPMTAFANFEFGEYLHDQSEYRDAEYLFPVIAAVVGFKYANAHYQSHWRIPASKPLLTRLKVAFYVALGAYLFLGIPFCFSVRSSEGLAEFYVGDIVYLFNNSTGMTAFAIGTLFTLYWARLIFPKDTDSPTLAEASAE